MNRDNDGTGASTLAQKLIGRACGRSAVRPGEIVTCRVDLAMVHDSSGPRRHAEHLERLGARVWDRERLVVISDHYVPAEDEAARRIVLITRDWTRAHRVRHYDSEGICHVVLPERGHVRPGMFIVGGDSHSPTGGAFGAYMFGVGATEMLGVLVTGETWVQVPETIRYRFDGRLAGGVAAKDVMLFLIGRFGMDGGRYQAVEYAGAAIEALPMQERMTLANMAAELGAQVGLVAPDAITHEWLAQHGVAPEALQAIDFAALRTDDGAALAEHHDFDAARLEPQVAAPHSPANAAPVSGLAGEPIDIAYIGACTGAKLADLQMAAKVLRGRRVARGVQLQVAPASVRDREAAAADGSLAVLTEAGATLLPSACGACAGYGANRFGENVRVISTTARNFRGRMGAASSRVWLASPYTVAASALAGCIADPRELM